MSQNGRYYLGIDVGGTFTDLILFDVTSGQIWLGKVPSTPPDFSTGVVAAVRQALAEAQAGGPDVVRFAHGTTIGTNTVLEGKGARLGLLTTQGFRDILEIGRQDRPDIYDLLYDQARPLVPRDRRLGVPERIMADGRVASALDREAAVAAIRRLLDDGIEVLAVSLLHSHSNPRHERELAMLAKEIAPDLPVTLSSDVLPEFREYERTATTAMNAYVMPATERYLSRLGDAVTEEGVRATLGVMQSNGGLLPVSAAGRYAVGALLSGPAAGVVGAVEVAGTAGFSDLITFDMGGTSCDVSLVNGRQPRIAGGGTLAGYPIQVPMLDIHTVGAGGGSIASLLGSALKVGPESAGAVPGPVCYGRGGVQPTVSDAHAALGHLSTRRFLDGKAQLDIRGARAAIDRALAAPLGLSVERAALGILAVADDHMMHAIRVVSVERGYDPRGSALVAFGGAGPLHASSVARLLNIETVLIPTVPGALSALGLLLADTRRDLVRTWLRRLDTAQPEEAEAVYAELEADGRRQLVAEGVESAAVWTTRTADLRYKGQAFELSVAVSGQITPEMLARMEHDFHAAHLRAYGHAAHGQAVELVNLRVQVWGRVPKPTLRELPIGERRPIEAACIGRRPVGILDDSVEEIPVYDRPLLQPGDRLHGPAIVEQADTTTLIATGDELEVDRFGNLVIRVSAEAAS